MSGRSIAALFIVIILFSVLTLGYPLLRLPAARGFASTPFSTVVILAQFPDRTGASTAAQMNSLVFTDLSKYINEQSYGAASITGGLASHNWLTLPMNTTEYNALGFMGACANNMIQDAIDLADGFVNFSNFKIVVVVFAGNSAGTCTPRGFSPEVTSVSFSTAEGPVRRAALFAENNIMATIAHEYIHTLGMGDLYHAMSGTGKFVGRWDPMSWPAGTGASEGYLEGLLAWTRERLGWIPAGKTVNVSGTGTFNYTLNPLESSNSSTVLIRIPINATSSYYVENRQLIGHDANLLDSGVLISTTREDIYATMLGTGNGPVRLVDSNPGSSTDIILDLDDAAFDIGTGEISTYTDAAHGILISLLSKTGSSYVVSVFCLKSIP